MAISARTTAGFVAIVLLVTVSALAGLAQPGGIQMKGAVADIADGIVTLADGSTFPLAQQPNVRQIWPVTASDLTPGMYVAVAAMRLPDGALLASVVAVFPETSRGAGEGQRAMTEIRFCEPMCQPDDLMTNATIEDARLEGVEGGELTITFLGETGRVIVTPDTRIEIQTVGSLEDIVPGAEVVAFVNPQGVAGAVWVYMS